MTIVTECYVSSIQNLISEIGETVTHKRITAASYSQDSAYQTPSSLASYSINESLTVYIGQAAKIMSIEDSGYHTHGNVIMTATASTSLAIDDIIERGSTHYRIENLRDVNISGYTIAYEATLRRIDG